MNTFAFRLKPGMDLKTGIEAFANEHGLGAGFVLTCVGGLSQATIRMAGATPSTQDIRTLKEDFEIISLVGTTGPDGGHFHIAISDKSGRILGGHLKTGTIVFPTAEIVLGDMPDSAFTRAMDDETGFAELDVTPLG